MVYFDNAATSYPKPVTVRQAVLVAMQRYGANPGRSGHTMADETAEQIYAVREKAVAMFGAQDVEQVVFTQNCTYALNTVVKGLLHPGDHVIISDLEHNSVLRPIYALSQAGIITYTVVKTCLSDAERTVETFRLAIRPNTKAIITTHASNAFGCKLPVEKLGALAKQYGLFYIVDAAQTAGIEPIHMQNMQIDFLCMPGHKGLYGPSGTGMLIAKNGAALRPLVEGGTGSVSMDFVQPDFMPDRLESGTLNTLGIIGLGAGMDYVSLCGIEKLAAHEMMVLTYIWDGFSQIEHVRLYTTRPTVHQQVAVLSFNIAGLSPEQTAARLNILGFAVRGGLQCAPLAHRKFGTEETGTVRVSVGAFNSAEDGCLLVGAVRKIAQEANRAK